MKPTRLIFENYKKFKSLNIDFPANGVLIVKGPPNSGKSSVLQAIDTLGRCGKSENLLSRDSNSGNIETSFLAADGLTYCLKQDLTADTNRFLLTMPNGINTRKISDIQSILKYNPFTLDEFINMSYTAEGRRKQRDFLLKIMPKEIQDEFFALEFEEKELTGKSPELRKKMEASIATLHTLKQSVTELDFTDTKEELLQQGKLNKIDLDFYSEYKSKSEPLFTWLSLLVANDESNRTMFADSLFKQYFVCDRFITELSNIKEELSRKYYQLEAHEKATESINKTQLEVDLNTKLFRDNETSIELKREAKKALIAGYKFPLENIVVDTDGVWIRVDGQLYELKREQVSTSELYKGCFEIATAIESNDLVLIDRGESLGLKNIEWIDDIAKTRDVLVLITVVDDSTDNVLFELVNNK
jgi:hypothetical protein